MNPYFNGPFGANRIKLGVVIAQLLQRLVMGLMTGGGGGGGGVMVPGGTRILNS
jgi:hypothetical protein